MNMDSKAVFHLVLMTLCPGLWVQEMEVPTVPVSNELRALETTLFLQLQASCVVLSCLPMTTRNSFIFISCPVALMVQAAYGAAPVQLQYRANRVKQQRKKLQYSSTSAFIDWQGFHNAFRSTPPGRGGES